MQYPECTKKKYQKDYFGNVIEDPYYWLTDGCQPEVLEWAKKENEFTDEWFDRGELERKITWLKEKKKISLYTNISRWGNHLAATRREDGYPRVVKLDQNMERETLVMERGTLPGFTPFSVKICPADDNLIAVCGLYDRAARLSVLVIDCRERTIKAVAENTFTYTWSADSPVLYYIDTVSDVEAQICTSRICTCNALTGEKENAFEVPGNPVFGNVITSTDRKTLMFELWDDYSHTRFLSYYEKTGVVYDITAGTAVEMQYIDSMQGRHYFIRKENAPFGEVISVEEGKKISEAVLVRKEGKEVLDSGFILKGKLYLIGLKAACARLLCLDKKDGEWTEKDNGFLEKEIELPGKMGQLVHCGSTADEIFLQYESFTQPPMLLSFDGEYMKVLKKTSEEEHPDIVVEQRYARSTEDQKEIPYFMVRHKDCRPGMKAPVWMYAYGGYNFSALPGYENGVTGLQIAEWAENGGIYILASIRGGNEFGACWHEEGMLEYKKNCYYDMIGITEQLITDGWTEKGKIVVSGASNGGLMVSALVTMRPDLYTCAIASVPQTDML